MLGFPYIFRGAIDSRATLINDEMKLAAARAIARLAHEPVPDEVKEAYGQPDMAFGKDYILPKPMDPRLLEIVAPAVAKAAIESSVARLTITDWDGYRHSLNKIASQCSDGVCYSQLLNSRRTLEKVSRELGYKL